MPSFSYLLDAAGFGLGQLAAVAAVAATSWVCGETLLRRLRIERQGGRWALAGALGLGLLAQATFFLGIVGWLHRPLVLGLLAAAHLACLGTWKAAIERLAAAPRTAGVRTLGLGAAILLPLFLLALYPPTGFDATVYHLPYARAFVEAGELAFLPDLRFPVFPQAGEAIFVLAFFLGGEITAQLTQLLATILAAGLLAAWGRELVSRRAGMWAAALWLGNPLIVWLGTAAYVDVSLGLYLAAAFYAWERWAGGAGRRWLGLAAAFGGLAAATKYLGLFFCAALALLTAVRGLRTRDPRPVLTFGAIAFLVLVPWYARIVYHTSNPVFPFYAPLFGASEWTSLHDQALPAAGADAGARSVWAVARSQTSRILEGLGFLVRVPYSAVFDRGVFHWQAPLTPVYLALLPLGVPLALLWAPTRRLLVIVAVYGLFWLTTVRDLRFLVAGIPLLNVALAAALDRWTASAAPKSARRLATPLAALLLMPGLLYAGYKLYEHGPLPVTAEQRSAYLTRGVTGYQAIAWLNAREGADYTVYALHGENLRYYAAGRFLGDWFGPARFSRIEAVRGDGQALYDELTGLGACYLLVRDPRPRSRLPADDTFHRRFELRLEADGFALYRLLGTECAGASRARRGQPRRSVRSTSSARITAENGSV